MVETVTWILAATAGVFVLLIIAVNIYFRIRPRLRIRVNCWFCHENTTIPYGERSCWDCPFCEQYNGFEPDGSYNKVIAAQHEELLNPPVTPRGPAKGRQASPPTGDENGLCFQCNTNQQLKVHQLATFAPSHPSRHDDEIDNYQRKLEQYYRLCKGCEAALEKTLAGQAAWMVRLRLDRLRKSALLDKDALASRFAHHRATASRCLCCATAALASCLLASANLPLSSSEVAPTVVSLLAGVLAWETSLTAGGGAAQLLAGICQTPLGSRWPVVNVLCVAMWAVLHGLCWIRTLDEVNTWVSPRDMKVIHAGFVLTTVVGCLIATFKPRPTVGKIAIGKMAVGKKPALVPTSADKVDFSDGEEVEATPANSKGRLSDSQHVAAAKPRSESPPNNVEGRLSDSQLMAAAKRRFNNTPDVKYETVSSNKCSDEASLSGSFRTFRSCREESCVPGDDRGKTRSRRVPTTTARTPSDITDMLTGSAGNISLPVASSTPEGEECGIEGRLPADLGTELSNLRLGDLFGGRQRTGPDDGYMDLFKGAASCRKRPVVLTPSRLRPRSHTSWVAGGYWREDNSAAPSPPSQTSSQSSGFASRSSQVPNSRSSSVCSGDYDAQSIASESFSATEVKRNFVAPTLLYNVAGGFGHPGSVSSDGIDSAFDADKTFQSCPCHGDRRVCYTAPLFPPPQHYYFPQSYGPSQYHPTPYGARYCYPSPMLGLWNSNPFSQRQLCITQPGEGSLSETSDSSLETSSATNVRIGPYRVSLANVLVVVALVCSLYYNAVYLGVFSLTKPW